MEQTLLEMLSQQTGGVALAVSDPQGRLTMVTPALGRIMGRAVHDLSEETLRPLGLRDPSTGRALTRSDMPLLRACAGELVRDQVMSMRRPDGLTIYLRCSAAPLGGQGAEDIRGAICLVQDVTAEWTVSLKQAELRDRLVRTVNHEIRTPLTKILGHCELLEEAVGELGSSLPDQVRSSIEAISRAGHELAALARRVTSLADLEAATQLSVGEVDLALLVRQEVDTWRLAASDKVVGILVDTPATVMATVDERLVTSALREILDNALDHAPSSSTIGVTLRTEDGHVELEVTDQGPGVPAEDRERVLAPFERGPQSDPSDSSPGLGLAVASAVAAAHGGSVALEDAQPRGLTVRMVMLRHLD